MALFCVSPIKTVLAMVVLTSDLHFFSRFDLAQGLQRS